MFLHRFHFINTHHLIAVNFIVFYINETVFHQNAFLYSEAHLVQFVFCEEEQNFLQHGHVTQEHKY